MSGPWWLLAVAGLLAGLTLARGRGWLALFAPLVIVGGAFGLDLIRNPVPAERPANLLFGFILVCLLVELVWAAGFLVGALLRRLVGRGRSTAATPVVHPAPPEVSATPQQGKSASGKPDWKVERELWLARLAADPERRHYLEEIARGEPWSEAQVRYDSDPSALATTGDLRVVEAAMRAAGVRLRYSMPGHVSAPCRVDPARLRQRFPDLRSLRIEHNGVVDRERHGPETWITAGKASRIWIQDSASGSETPWFPSLGDAGE